MIGHYSEGVDRNDFGVGVAFAIDLGAVPSSCERYQQVTLSLQQALSC